MLLFDQMISCFAMFTSVFAFTDMIVCSNFNKGLFSIHSHKVIVCKKTLEMSNLIQKRKIRQTGTGPFCAEIRGVCYNF